MGFLVYEFLYQPVKLLLVYAVL
uniref:Uncharacterized protein n=1 Tax=Rhizophora mucronata TaxID=61149 RepID=A0A2P2PSZ9_RHIMU